YVDADTHLRWRCARGHEWTAPGHGVRTHGSWCPFCAKNRMSIEELRIVAELRGGECLSKRIEGAGHEYIWRCRMGHTFRAVLMSIVHQESWCPTCNKVARGTLKRMRDVARARGGECLSVRYVSSTSELLWRCREGHEWRAKPGRV